MREKFKKFWNSLTARYNAWCERRKQPEQLAQEVSETAETTAEQSNTQRVAQNQTARRAWRSIWRTISRFIRNLLLGAILLQVAAYFVPDLPEKMPTWYRLSELIIQLFEWLLKISGLV